MHLFFAGCSTTPPKKETYSSDNIANVIYGNWYVKNFSSLPISALTDEEAQKFVEQSISLSKTKAIVLNDTCSSPDYSIKKVPASVYLKDYRVTGKEIGIKSDTIYTIDLKCKTTPKYFNDLSYPSE